jgi:hypothetical protein
MRGAGAAGFSAKKVRAAGHTAIEACEAAWTVEVLSEAGYEPTTRSSCARRAERRRS